MDTPIRASLCTLLYGLNKFADRGINTLRTKAAQQLHRDYHIHYTQSKNHLGIAVEFCGNMSEPRYDGVLAEDACPAYLK